MEERGNILIYQTGTGDTQIEVRLQEDTIWLTQDQMANLFEKAKSTINEHIKNIYSEKELDNKSTMNKFGISEFAKKPASAPPNHPSLSNKTDCFNAPLAY